MVEDRKRVARVGPGELTLLGQEWGKDLTTLIHSCSSGNRKHILSYPSEGLRAFKLAEPLVSCLTRPCLVYVDNHLIWPSDTDWPLYRVVVGEDGLELNSSHQLSDVPGFLFDESASEESLSALLTLCIDFGWETVIVEKNAIGYWLLSHDEFVVLPQRQPDEFKSILDRFTAAGFKE